VRVVSARDADVRAVVLAAIEPLIAARRSPGGHPIGDWAPMDLARRVTLDVAGADVTITRRRTFTARLDAFLLHPALGPILFLGIMATLFAAVFLVADPATTVIDDALGWLRTRLSPLLGGGLLASFVTDGVLGGCGTVLAFMPQIVILTIAMELLEASGYLARGAFLVDRLLRVLGLSGRSFLPLLMSHACAVPAIASTRTIRDPRERLTTILVLPLMTCSARIPTYALILGTFFASRGAWFKALAFVGLYASGVLAGLVASLVLRRTATRGKSLPLVLEMPQYRTPQPRVVLRTAGQAAWRFTRDVGTTILAVSVALWVLLTVPMPGRSSVATTQPTPAAQTTETVAEEPPLDRSIAAAVGRSLEPITQPVGFDWRINVGLIASFGARELMVGTLGVIFGVEDADDDATPLAEHLREAKAPDGSPAYGTRTALALLAFFVLACQCMSTVAAIRRETKSWRWPAIVLAYTYSLAYAAAFVVYQAAGWLGIT
jgi:ferrous iron transport protein B